MLDLTKLKKKIEKIAESILTENETLLKKAGIDFEDLVGEAFARIIEDKEKFDTTKSKNVDYEKFCIYRARYAMLELLRWASKSIKLNTVSMEEENEDGYLPIPSTENVEKNVHNRLILNAVRECFEKLPEKERFILKARMIHEVKLGELAKCFGCSGERIRQIHLESLEKMKSCLRKKGITKAEI